MATFNFALKGLLAQGIGTAVLQFCSSAAKCVTMMPIGQRKSAAMLCTIALFGLTVSSILQDPSWLFTTRDLDVVELWSGVGSITAAARQANLAAQDFDILNNPAQDVTIQQGFLLAVRLVMRLKVKGLLTMAPVCSSFGFASSSHTKRKRTNFAGDLHSRSVQSGNMMANVAMFLLSLAVAREIETCLENPAGSMLFSFLKCHLARLPWLVTMYCDRCAYLSGKDLTAQPWKKHFKLVATGKWLSEAMRLCKCRGQRHPPLMDTDAKGNRNGRLEDMKLSGSYPRAMGKAVVDAWLKWQREQMTASLQQTFASDFWTEDHTTVVAPPPPKPATEHGVKKTAKSVPATASSKKRKAVEDADFFYN